MAAYCRVYGVIHFTSPAGWLPVHRDQLWAQRSVTSMGKLYLFLLFMYIHLIYILHKNYRLSAVDSVTYLVAFSIVWCLYFMLYSVYYYMWRIKSLSHWSLIKICGIRKDSRAVGVVACVACCAKNRSLLDCRCRACFDEVSLAEEWLHLFHLIRQYRF